jgi:hypothetical protein
MPPNQSTASLLNLLSEAHEFHDIRFQNGEKAVLNAMNRKDKIKYPLPGRIATVPNKVSVMLQCALGHVPFQDPKLGHLMESEVRRLLQSAGRVIKFIVDYARINRDATSLSNALDLHKALNVRSWDDPDNPESILRQIDGIGSVLASKLVQSGIRSVDTLQRTSPRSIELLCKRNPPFGNTVIEDSKRLPQLNMELSQVQEFQPQAVGQVMDVHVRLYVTNHASCHKRTKTTYVCVRPNPLCVPLVLLYHGFLFIYLNYSMSFKLI